MTNGQKDLKPTPLHLTTTIISPHHNPLLPVRSAFAYFSGACEKWVASKREARGETAFELELDLQAATPGQASSPSRGETGLKVSLNLI